ncbi:hypothetical protein [Rhodococcus zopfii]|uniref:hypothetical protein n=1 Tax=Rhodococcus zopfii TaxID=43772 RepID=UPI00093213AC
MPVLSRFAPTRPRALAAVLSLTAVVAGCSGSPDGAATVVGPTSTEVTVPVSAVTTTVLDPGAEPRDVMRLTPALDTVQQIDLTTSSQVFQQIGDQPRQDFSSPEVTLPLTATVTQAVSDADPSTIVDLTLGEATSPDGSLMSAFASASGSGAGLTIGPNGAVSALRLRPAPNAPDAARAAIEQAFYQAVYRMVSFPDTPVGVGAVWEIHQQVMSGITLDQVSTATLVSRDGDRLTVRVSIVQTPQDSAWELPNGAGHLNIDSFTMAGDGILTIDPAQPLPVDGELTLTGDQAYSDPEGTTELAQSLQDRVHWQARQP